MKDYKDFAKMIKSLRTSANESLPVVASALGIDKSYVSKLENGHLKPTIKLLEKIIAHYSPSEEEIRNLYITAGYGAGIKITSEGEGVTRMEDKIPGSKVANDSAAEVNVPNNMPVLYTDSIFINSNPFGTTIEFATRLGTTNKHQVVARIGMSIEHLKKFIKVLEKHLENPGIEITRRVES